MLLNNLIKWFHIFAAETLFEPLSSDFVPIDLQVWHQRLNNSELLEDSYWRKENPILNTN